MDGRVCLGVLVVASVFALPVVLGVVIGGCTNTTEWQVGTQACFAEVEELHSGTLYQEFLTSPNNERLDTICRTYLAWLVCTESLLKTCQMTFKEADSSLRLAHRLVKDTCDQRKESTLQSLECLVSQSSDSNPLYKGCHILMDLKNQAGVFDICSVAQEYVHCEDRLLRSACGSRLADFTLALSVKSKFRKLGVYGECTYTPQPNYSGFSYTMHCSPAFPVRMRTCYSAFQDTKVALYHSMLAIIRGTAIELHAWCRAYSDYEQCMAPIEDACPTGVSAVYRTENEWHRVVMVADYLCGRVLNDYKRFLPCYKRMMRHSTSFNLCRKVFDKYPTKYEAYRVKCSPDAQASKSNMEKREQLIECFTSFMRKDCGLNASVTIEPLIRMQYSFDFLPPCEEPSVKSCPTTGGAAAVRISHTVALWWTFLLTLTWKSRVRLFLWVRESS